MPIILDCPRCKQLLSVPKKKAGGYVTCPKCNGRLWVSKPTDAVTPQQQAIPPQQTSQGDYVSMRDVLPTDSPQPIAGPPGLNSQPPSLPATPQTSPKHVAQFITADAAESTLTLASDGNLPELHLQENDEKDALSDNKSAGSNPFVIFAAICMSVAFSLLLVMTDFESESSTDIGAKDNARRIIEDEYFADQEFLANTQNNHKLKPYQLYLREAQQAHSRGNFKTERRKYRKVLELLHAERGHFAHGLTGSQANDKRLQEQISTMLRGSN